MMRRIRDHSTMEKKSSPPCMPRLTACALCRIDVRPPQPDPTQTAQKKRDTTKNAAAPAP